MKNIKYFIIILYAITLSFGPFNKVFAQCQQIPSSQALTADFLQYLQDITSGKNNRIAVLPFRDNVAIKDEYILADGIPFAIYDMFVEKNPQFLHPYLSFNSLRTLNIGSSTLYKDATAKKIAKNLKVRFVIFGEVQRSSAEEIRVLIKVYDHKTGKVSSPAAEFKTYINDSFFTLLHENVKEAFETLKGGKSILKKSPPYRPSMQSFRYYAKGMVQSLDYDETQLNIAEIWMEKAYKESYLKNIDTTVNLARIIYMKAMIHRLSKQDYTNDLLKAQKVLARANYLSSETNPKLKTASRFKDGFNSFTNAITAYKANNSSQAYKFTVKTLQNLPEDGFSQYLIRKLSQGKKNPQKLKLNNPVCF